MEKALDMGATMTPDSVPIHAFEKLSAIPLDKPLPVAGARAR
jgi:hypothetical protein